LSIINHLSIHAIDEDLTFPLCAAYRIWEAVSVAELPKIQLSTFLVYFLRKA
jgi:hypothetical protein